MLKLRLSILLALMLAFYDISARVPGVSDNCVLLRSLVFGGPDSVSKFYRIPALAISSDGAIVAVADRRRDSEGDLPGNIDVVCRRSTDGGQNWSPAITIAACDENGGYGDPALGVDRRSGDLVCVFTHGNGLWNSTPDNHAYIYSCRSSDGGLSWSQPADITPSLFDWYGKAPVKAVTAFASSGGILTCSDGTMWFCLIAKPEQEKWGRLQVYAVRSTDGDHSWQIMPQPVDEDGDESKIVQLADGSLLMSIRNRRQGWRKFARSTDGGHSWSKPEFSATLPDPAINGDILRLPDGRLLHSICDSNSERSNVSVFVGDRRGDNWEKVFEVCPAPSSYSAMVLMPDGRLGILSEELSAQHGLHLWFTKVSISAW